MTSKSSDKQIILEPSWKQFLTGYLLSILAIPLFGIGLIGLYYVRKKQKRVRYRISDTQITSVDERFQRNIDLVNIEQVETEISWLQEKLGIGKVILSTTAATMELVGMEQPRELKQMIEQAVAFQKRKQQETVPQSRPEPKYKPGSMDRMDYLTGLWQQGLLSDEDYEDERKHFE